MIKRLRLLMLGLLVGALLTAGSAQAEVVHLGGHFLGVTPHSGVRPASIPGAMARMATSGATSSSVLSWQGGPVVHSSAPYLIFWAPAGETLPAGTQSLLTRYFSDVASVSGTAGNVYGVARQYYDATGIADYRQTFSAGQVITDTNPYPSGASNCTQTAATYGTCLTDTQLESEIQGEIGALHLPADGAASATSLPANAPIYFVVLPSDVNLCSASDGTDCASNKFCAYHSSFTAGATNVLYAAIPTLVLGSGQNPKACQWDGNAAVQEPNASTADVALKYLSHEDNETLTDPLGTAWWDPASGYENGDNCNAYGSSADPANGYSPKAFAPTLGGSLSGTLYNQLIADDPYYLQSEWSNGDSSCDLRPPASTLTPAFSVSPSPAAGTSVSFDPSASASAAGVTSASWTFGDGATAFYSAGQTLTAPSHSYAAGGTYTVTLTLVDGLGNLATSTQQLSVAGPSPAFTAPPATENAAVAFDASASTDIPAGGSITYAWNFGDKTRGSGAAATHTYLHYGTYTVTLTETDGAGLTSSVSHQLVVADESPTVSIAGPASTPGTGQPAAFSATAGDPDGTIASYVWNFGDGVTANGASVAHTYTTPGTYPVTVTVTDSDGGTAQTTQTVAVVGPAAAFTAPAPALEGTVLSFTAAAPGSGSAGTVAYDWSFGDGSAPASGPSATHAYATAGTYTATLTETDSSGDTTSVSQTVTVLDEAPSASFTITSALASTQVPATFSAAASVDPDGSVASYSWQFGDGTTGTGEYPSHQYAAAGVYPVTLTVTDSAGQTSAPVSLTVTVYAPPTAVFAVAGNGAPEHQAMSFNAATSSSAGPGGPITGDVWSFGDGTGATGIATTHAYSAPGHYAVTLRVTNAVGLSSAVTQWVTVGDEAPSVRIKVLATHPSAGVSIGFDSAGSSDPDGQIAGYQWSFGDGGGATASRPQHVYRAAGRYAVTLTVIGSGGERASASAIVTVAAPARVTAVHMASSATPTLVIALSAAGTLRVGTHRIVMHGAGQARVALHLTRAQQRALAHRRTLHLVVNLTFTPLVGAVQRQRVLITVRPGAVRSRRYTVALRP